MARSTLRSVSMLSPCSSLSNNDRRGGGLVGDRAIRSSSVRARGLHLGAQPQARDHVIELEMRLEMHHAAHHPGTSRRFLHADAAAAQGIARLELRPGIGIAE